MEQRRGLEDGRVQASGAVAVAQNVLKQIKLDAAKVEASHKQTWDRPINNKEGKKWPYDKSSTEKSPNEKSPNEKSPNEKSPNAKSPNEKSPNEKSPNEKSPNEKSPKQK